MHHAKCEYCEVRITTFTIEEYTAYLSLPEAYTDTSKFNEWLCSEECLIAEQFKQHPHKVVSILETLNTYYGGNQWPKLKTKLEKSVP